MGNKRFVIYDNAPAHQSVLVKDFLAKNNVTMLEHLPYCLYLAPADFFPAPLIEIGTEGTAFCDATDVIKNVTEELKTLAQNVVQEWFQHFYRLG